MEYKFRILYSETDPEDGMMELKEGIYFSDDENDYHGVVHQWEKETEGKDVLMVDFKHNVCQSE